MRELALSITSTQQQYLLVLLQPQINKKSAASEGTMAGIKSRTMAMESQECRDLKACALVGQMTMRTCMAHSQLQYLSCWLSTCCLHMGLS